MYIVRDTEKGSELAYRTLQEARYASLEIKQGEVVRVKLNIALDKAQLRCALFNRTNYFSERTTIAVIENGIARKIV